MLLDRFILNTDYDSQKESDVLEIQLPIGEFNLAGDSTRNFETTVKTDDGEYFENIYVKNSEITGNYTMMGGVVAYRRSGQFNVNYKVYRSDKTHYKLEVSYLNLTSSTIVIPTNKVIARVHLLVASKD